MAKTYSIAIDGPAGAGKSTNITWKRHPHWLLLDTVRLSQVHMCTLGG